jgi:1,4-alpha-glucan branching enzyme
LAEGFAYQGEPSLHRQGQERGEPSGNLGRAAFINFLQNHDQIGNRPLGERLTAIVKAEAMETALAVLLLQPSPPLLFMGEEWGATEPFPFFCDFKGELADAVRNGRRREFADAYAKHGGEIPDPLKRSTFDAAKLDWDSRSKPEHAKRLALIKALLAARRRFVVPLLPEIAGAGEASLENGILTARWHGRDRALYLAANLTGEPKLKPARAAGDQIIWDDSPPGQRVRWSVIAAIGV